MERGNEIMQRNTEAFERNTEAFEANRRFHHELMKRMERWSIAMEARMIELSEHIKGQGERIDGRITDQGELIRAQTDALYRILDRLPPATS